MRLEATDAEATSWVFRSDPGDPEHSLDGGHDFWARRAEQDPDARIVPDPYRAATLTVFQALAAGNTDFAERAARALLTRAEEEQEPSHPFALRARELHAHTLLAQGDPVAATEAYTEVARVWGGEDYGANVRRACACWERIKDPAAVLATAPRLLRLLRSAGPEAAPLREHVIARLARLSAEQSSAPNLHS